MAISHEMRQLVRGELLLVVRNPGVLRLYATDTGLDESDLPTMGSLKEQVQEVLNLCETKGDETLVRFLKLVERDFSKNGRLVTIRRLLGMDEKSPFAVSAASGLLHDGEGRGKNREDTGTLQPGPDRPIARRLALLVGINQYDDPSYGELYGCVNDVKDLGAALENTGYTNVRLLHDEAADPRLQPTRSNIRATLRNLCQYATRDDLIWIHFSCHGKLVNGIPVLLTRELRLENEEEDALPLTQIKDILRTSPARCILLTLDACHQGLSPSMRSTSFDPGFYQRAYELAQGFVVIAASASNQGARDLGEHGLMTSFVLEALYGKGEWLSRPDRSPCLPVGALQRYVEAKVLEWCHGRNLSLQRPNHEDHGQGSFIVLERPVR